MKQNKYSIRPAIIEALIILTTSMLTLLLREVLGMMTYIIPITLLVVFILLKVFYRKGTSWIHRHATSKESVANLSTKASSPNIHWVKLKYRRNAWNCSTTNFSWSSNPTCFERKKRMT